MWEANSYSMILPLFFSFINIHELANEMILYMTIVCKDLSTCITDDIYLENINLILAFNINIISQPIELLNISSAFMV